MTPQEAIKVRDARPDLALQWYHHHDGRFVYLKGHPCPLLQMDGTRASCTVHAVRPYNCRRFGCFRPDPHTEPYEPEPLDLARGRLGCANLSDRLAESRSVRRAYARMQRRATHWAVTHGWPQELAPTPAGSNVVFYRLAPVSQGSTKTD